MSEGMSVWKGWSRRASKGEIPTLLNLGRHPDSHPRLWTMTPYSGPDPAPGSGHTGDQFFEDYFQQVRGGLEGQVRCPNSPVSLRLHLGKPPPLLRTQVPACARGRASPRCRFEIRCGRGGAGPGGMGGGSILCYNYNYHTLDPIAWFQRSSFPSHGFTPPGPGNRRRN